MPKAPPKKPTAKWRAVADTIAGYLAAIPAAHRSSLRKLRATIRAAVPGTEEHISYRVPIFAYRGKHLVAMAAFENHCSFFVMSLPVMRAHKDDLKGLDTSGATIRCAPGETLPATLVKKLIRARMAEIDAKLPGRPARAAKPRSTKGRAGTRTTRYKKYGRCKAQEFRRGELA